MGAANALFQAMVLHRRDYGDTSLLLEVFALERGRFPAIAKGARRPRQPLSALLQPFQPLWLGAVGRGEVLTLTRVEAAGPAIALQDDALLCGFYLNELLVRLLGREDPHDAVFAFYHAALVALGAGASLDVTLRRFELQLLDELGYGLALDVDAAGAPVVSGRRYRVQTGQLQSAHGEDEEGGIRVAGATLLALRSLGGGGVELTPPQRREARALLRALLEPHLGGKPLRTRELFRRWNRGEPASRVGSHQDH